MRWVILLALALLLFFTAEHARADHSRSAPTKLRVIERIYPDLHARESARAPRHSWTRLRAMTRTRWVRTHPAARRAHEFRELLRRSTTGGYGSRQTAAANRALARRFFGDAYGCAATIIGPETGHTWDHRIEYGFDYGPHLIYSGQAYGIGQARPGVKMLPYGADAATNVWTQFRWFRAYAEGRYGSLCSAASFWTANRHW